MSSQAPLLSIFETVKENPANPLPDQQDLTLQSEELWVAGAYEGTLLRSDFSIKQPLLVNYWVARKIKKYILQPSEKNRKAAESCISKYSAISLADPVLSFLSGMQLEPSKMYQAARTLAVSSSHRETVKFAIALLGYCGKGNKEAANTVKILSHHDEFAFYGIVALKNILPEEEATEVLLSLGEKLTGWGKIALMYELDYSREDVRSWTLKKGCRNCIGLSYLANVCAIKGKLKEYLLEKEMEFEPIDSDYFQGICDIFRGLLEENQKNDGIYEYPEAVAAANSLRTVLKFSPKEMQEAAGDIITQLDIKKIGDPKAADSVISF